MESDLQDLIAVPRETLEIELKPWLDLDETAVRAKIARHLAALANHGGGYLIFGFNDDLSHDQNRPDSLKNYNRDVFTGIVRRYLTPTFQCEVAIVPDKNGEQFPIIRVPGHGSVPIVAKADGPNDNKGRIQGIKAGTYYIRKPGPESAPIRGGEEWRPLIRRCVLNDRDRLLSDIAGLVRPPEKTEPDARRRLEEWHREAEKRFLQCLLEAEANGLRWPVPIERNHYQLSYLISTDGHEDLPTNSLGQILEEVDNEVRNTVWTGWSMFFPFRDPKIAPGVFPERRDGTGGDVLEANLMSIRDFDRTLPDFWRVAPDGRVTLIRAYREDRQRNVRPSGRAAGTWLSPETVIRETTELVAHARSLARRFETATTVTFQCSWIGLKDREIADFDSSYWRPHTSGAEQRTTKGEWTVTELGAAWSTIVAELSCPILRLFTLDQCNQAFVENMAPKFVKL